MRRTLAGLAIFVATFTVVQADAALAQSSPMTVQIDRSQRISLQGSVASVIVANPLIADVTVVDANTLFITGKGYGVTEIIAVDGVGRTLFQNQVVVSGGQTGSVRVWRGGQVTEMACAASCAPSIRSSGSGAAAAPTP